MQPTELLKIANAARPDLVSKVASVMAILAKVSPGHASDLSKEVDAILTHTQEKTAKADVAGFGMAMAGTLVAGLGTAVASDLYDAAKRGLSRGSNFRRILDSNPDLEARHKRDPKTVMAAFNTVHRYAPEFTADPLFGGSLVTSLVESPGSAAMSIKDLMGARKSLRDAKAKQFSAGHVHLEHDRFQEQKDLGLAKEVIDKRMEEVRHANSMSRDAANRAASEQAARSLEVLKHRHSMIRDRLNQGGP